MKRHMNNIRHWKTIVPFTAVVLICATQAWAGPRDTEKLTSFVKPSHIRHHLTALQKIADKNGNNRETGTAGDVATRNYIARRLTKAGFTVTRQEFTFDNFREITPAILERTSPLPFKAYKEGEPNSPEDFHITLFSGNGDVTAPIQAVNVVIPPGATPNSNASGCEAADFTGFTLGNIALIQRGSCPFRVKVDNAFVAGAVGVVLFNEGTPKENSGGVDRVGLVGSTLGPAGVTIPVVFARFTVGEELYNTSSQGTVTVHLATNAELVETTTENIFGETPAGDPAQVVMAGAHLDSVPEGPGINDNGTGVGTLLEIAKGMNALEISPRNKVRFAFWGAEEPGNIGSTQYVDGLNDEDKDKIALYLNFDMMGSTNFVPSVYDGDGIPVPPVFSSPGGPLAGQVEQVFVDYFNDIGAPPTKLAIDRRSDYAPFLDAGIPFGAITSGFDGVKTPAEAALFGGEAGKPYDPCYHEACDTIENVSKKALRLMAGAAIHAIMEFATREVIFPCDRI